MNKKEFKILSPTAILGYGFPPESFLNGIKRKPDLIAVDAGSTDPGPYYLGAGVSFTDRNAVKRDLTIMITGALDSNIPLIVGTAGGSGADVHLNWCVEIVKEIVIGNTDVKVAVISAEIPKEQVYKDALEDDASLAEVLEDMRAGKYGQFNMKMVPIYKRKD